jgi:hypothetical protein
MPVNISLGIMQLNEAFCGHEAGALSRSLTGVIIGKSWPVTYPFFQVRTSRFGDVY